MVCFEFRYHKNIHMENKHDLHYRNHYYKLDFCVVHQLWMLSNFKYKGTVHKNQGLMLSPAIRHPQSPAILSSVMLIWD